MAQERRILERPAREGTGRIDCDLLTVARQIVINTSSAMLVIEWFKGRAHRLEAAPANFPPLTATAELERLDDAEPDIATRQTGRLALDPAYLAMEYTDASGRSTSRPVTLLSLNLDAMPSIVAQCHLRKAIRTFRIDRIKNFVDENGEVLDPADFLATLSGQPVSALRSSSQPVAPTAGSAEQNPETILRTIFRDRVYLLVLAAKSDANFHPRELDAILGFIENEVSRMAASGTLLAPITANFLTAFADLVRRLRPRPSAIPTYVEGITSLGEEDQRRFWKALKTVIDADALLHDEEIALWQELQSLAGPT